MSSHRFRQMHGLVFVLACLVCTSHGRVQTASEHLHSSVHFERSQFRSRAEDSSPVKALATLLAALNPADGWQTASGGLGHQLSRRGVAKSSPDRSHGGPGCMHRGHGRLGSVVMSAPATLDSTYRPEAAPVAGSAYEQLTGVQLTRASDGKRVDLTSLWRKDVAFGLGGERAVVVFLRHFG